jgi:SOCE-associated regulatory factor of calcium homoeostasis
MLTAPSKVLLKDVEVLVFKRDELTTGSRTAVVQQMQCSGKFCGDSAGDAFSSAMCKNLGLGDDQQPMWECIADLPARWALGKVRSTHCKHVLASLFFALMLKAHACSFAQ